MHMDGAVEAQHELMAWARGVMRPMDVAAIDAWVLAELARDLDAQIDALVASGLYLPAGFYVVLRADGGLWLTTGHRGLWTIFDVPADAWMPSGRG